MKVGVYYNNHDVRIEEKPFLKIGDDDILLKIMASGICGSDLMEFHRKKKAPFVPGHEVAGIIEDVGKNIKEYQPGDRIFVTHHVPCDTCTECQRGFKTQCSDFKKVNNFEYGGFAPYVRVTGRSLITGVIRLPDTMTYEQGSFIEPLGTVVEVADKLNGDTVLIIGSGVAGLLNIQLSKSLGAGKVIATDINDYRLEAAEKFGADYVINAKEFTPNLLKGINKGRLADKVIICAGAKSATEQAFQSYEQGADIIFFATPPENEKVEIDWYEHWRNGFTIKPTYGASPEANKTAFSLIKNKVIKVDEMITHKLPLEEIAKGFEIASEGKDCLKVIIEAHKNE